MSETKYKALNNNIFTEKEYSIVPIRYQDRFKIMQWRNEQLYHLRQPKKLTEEDQERYFTQVVAKLFEKEQPDQLLFSYLKNGECIGYGGLVHINWLDRHAEISFVMKTELEEKEFEFHWHQFLSLIEKVGFDELSFHKIFTYAFDLRPRLYQALTNAHFKRDAVLNQHCTFDGQFIDVLIHSKLNTVFLRDLTINDLNITYRWATDERVRKFSFNKKPIQFESHQSWFLEKLNDPDCYYFILVFRAQIAGSIRFDMEGDKAIVSYLLDPDFHGKGLGQKLLELGMNKMSQNLSGNISIQGAVEPENKASIKIFRRLNFTEIKESHRLYFKKKIS